MTRIGSLLAALLVSAGAPAMAFTIGDTMATAGAASSLAAVGGRSAAPTIRGVQKSLGTSAQKIAKRGTLPKQGGASRGGGRGKSAGATGARRGRSGSANSGWGGATQGWAKQGTGQGGGWAGSTGGWSSGGGWSDAANTWAAGGGGGGGWARPGNAS